MIRATASVCELSQGKALFLRQGLALQRKHNARHRAAAACGIACSRTIVVGTSTHSKGCHQYAGGTDNSRWTDAQTCSAISAVALSLCALGVSSCLNDRDCGRHLVVVDLEGAKEPTKTVDAAVEFAPLKTFDETTANDDNNRCVPAQIQSLSNALQSYQERKHVSLGKLLFQFKELADEELALRKVPSSSPGSGSVGTSKTESREMRQAPQDAIDAASDEPSSSSTSSSTTSSSLMAQQQGADGVASRALPVYFRIEEGDLTSLRRCPERAWAYIDRMKNGEIAHRDDVKRIARSAAGILFREPTLIDLSDRNDELKTVTVVGDLHGHFSCSLLQVFDLVGGGTRAGAGRSSSGESVEGFGLPWDGTGAIVFNGDFIDRGDNSLEVLLSLLLLKLAYPDHVYLNRGNHEDSVISTVYGYSEELHARYGDGNGDGKHGNATNGIGDIWEAFEEVFAALPFALRTKHAAIIHGGLPSADFRLDELDRISSERRFRYKSLLEPVDDDVCNLLQRLVWSDPCPEEGIHPNEDRGCGMKFGPDVVRSFLSGHGLKYLVRSHEPVDGGVEVLQCSTDSTSVVTVFSAVSYPNGEGFNNGAVVRLHSDGTSDAASFKAALGCDDRNQRDDAMTRTFHALAEMISQNRTLLEDEFLYQAELNARWQQLQSAFTRESSDDDSMNVYGGEMMAGSADYATEITPNQWSSIMSRVIDLPNIDWVSLQPYLAPVVGEDPTPQRESATGDKGRCTGMINYRDFLDLQCNLVTGGNLAGRSTIDGGGPNASETLEAIRRNRDALLTVFRFLDVDGNGLVDRYEFNRGIEMLARRNGDSALLRDLSALFDIIDVDGNGTIELAEFEKMFESVEVPFHVAVLMLFDKNRDGKVSREEFRDGIRWLNTRLTEDEKIVKADELFTKLDLNGDGSLDVEEFEIFVRNVYPH